MLYSIVGSSLAGTFVIAALVSGQDTLIPILVAAGAGAVVALPVSFVIARKILSNAR
jgi:hypothetical protein